MITMITKTKNQTVFRIFFCALAASSTGAFASQTLERPVDREFQVASTAGTTFVISETEAKRVALEVSKIGSQNADAFFRNDDGSITVVNPKFLYRGQNYPIYETNDGLTGACVLFGFRAFVFSTSDRVVANTDLIRLDNEGHLNYFWTAIPDSVNVYHKITSITCSPREQRSANDDDRR